ncbi:hypothetical protein DFH29DRAFT_994433 [Suillus ampliporus]|nr:hypothetical protein DFH29DRAFT_994433 [Suillus ampliporus]
MLVLCPSDTVGVHHITQSEFQRTSSTTMGPARMQGVSHSSQQQLESKRRHDRYAANTSGLSLQSQVLLADMRDDNPQDQDFSMGDGMATLHEDDVLQWEMIPDNLQEDETFVHAVRNIVPPLLSLKCLLEARAYPH